MVLHFPPVFLDKSLWMKLVVQLIIVSRSTSAAFLATQTFLAKEVP